MTVVATPVPLLDVGGEALPTEHSAVLCALGLQVQDMGWLLVLFPWPVWCWAAVSCLPKVCS